LHFAETSWRFAPVEQRTFDVSINGEKKHAEVDVAAKVGTNRAWQLVRRADVAGRTSIVGLIKAKAGPAIKGIEVRALPGTDGG
jgi:hypothetical protein